MMCRSRMMAASSPDALYYCQRCGQVWALHDQDGTCPPEVESVPELEKESEACVVVDDCRESAKRAPVPTGGRCLVALHRLLVFLPPDCSLRERIEQA